MEWCSAQFKGEASHNKYDAQGKHAAVCITGGQLLRDNGHIQGACRAVHHGEAVQHETARHCPQHEIFHRCFRGVRVVTAQCHQRITRQGQQFQAEVQNDEVVSTHHDVHAQQREQGKREQLPTAQHTASKRIVAPINQRDKYG